MAGDSCVRHLFEPATAVCRTCRAAFCPECVVVLDVNRTTLCIDCALVAAGVRARRR